MMQQATAAPSDTGPHTDTDEVTRQVRRLLNDALARHDVDTVVAEVIVPLLHRVGDMWEEGRLGVLAEHAVSAVVTSVIDDTAHTCGRTRGTIVLACPPGELHDLPTRLFAAMLRARGFATVVLGANTSWPAMSRAVRTHGAQACIVTSIRAHSLRGRAPELSRMSRTVAVYVAGRAALGVHVSGVTRLPDDWRSACDLVTADACRRPSRTA